MKKTVLLLLVVLFCFAGLYAMSGKQGAAADAAVPLSQEPQRTSPPVSEGPGVGVDALEAGGKSESVQKEKGIKRRGAGVRFEKGDYVFFNENGDRVTNVPRYKKEIKNVIKEINGKKQEIEKSILKRGVVNEKNLRFFIVITEEKERLISQEDTPYKQEKDTVDLYDIEGKKLWEKQIKRLHTAGLAGNAPMVVMTSRQEKDYNDISPNEIRVIDELGKEVYFKRFSGSEEDDHISWIYGTPELSDDGKYLLFSAQNLYSYCVNLENEEWWKIKGVSDESDGAWRNNSVSFKGDRVLVSWDREKRDGELFGVYDEYSLEGKLIKSYKEKIVW